MENFTPEQAWNQYKFAKFHIQMNDVEMVSLKCENYGEEQPSRSLKTIFKTKSELVDDLCCIYLKVELSFEEKGPFSIEVEYKGTCEQSGELADKQFLELSEGQTVSLLLPYARESISSALARMKLPIYYLPTLDILESIKLNKSQDIQEGEEF